MTWITAEQRVTFGWAWLAGMNAVSSVTSQQRVWHKRGVERLSSRPRRAEVKLLVMEKTEIFLYTFLVSHYVFNILFVSWLFITGSPTEITNYGLSN